MPQTSHRHIFRELNLSRRFTIITIMFFGVIVGLLSYTVTTVHKDQSISFLIDVAGRQRMLLQKHINEVFLASQGGAADFFTTRELIRSSIIALMEGGPVGLNPETGQQQTLSAAPTEELLIKWREQLTLFNQIVERADTFLRLRSDHPEFREQMQTLLAQNTALVGVANEAVRQLHVYSDSNISTMLRWEILIAIAIGLLGIVVTNQGIRAGRRLESEIEERKRAESALLDSELFLNSIIENIPHMIFVKDAKNLRFLRFNQAGEKLLGYSRESLIGNTDYDFFSKSEADFFSNKDREVLAGKTLMDIPEEIIQTKSHGTRYLHTKKISILDSKGHPQYLLGISEDITDKKQHQILLEMMQQAKTQFILSKDPAEIFNNLLQSLLSITQSEYGFVGEILHTPEGKPYLKTQAITNIAWNQETRELYERFAPNLEFFNLNTLFGKVISTGQPVVANDPMNDPRSGGLPIGHPPIHGFLGLPFYRGNQLIGMVGMANRPEGYDEQLIAYLGPLLSTCGMLVEAHQNSQQRVQAEKTLRATEQMYRQILDSISDMVFVKDKNFRIFWANKAFRSYYNMTNEELKGILDSPINEPSFTREYHEADAHVLNTRQVFDIPEEPVIQHDGKVHLFHTIKAPLFGDNGEVTKLVGVSRNITERKNFETALETLAKGTVSLESQSFFQNLVRRLAHTLQVSMVFISKRVEETFPIVPGIAFWDGDHFESSVEYDCLKGPCEKVFDGTPVYIPQNVQKLFPKNPMVKALNLESYCGTPLFNSKGAIIGNLAIMDRKPLKLKTQDQSLLQIFAARAGAELERKQSEELILKGERKFRAIYEQAPTGIAILDSHSGQFTQINQKYCNIVGYSEEEMLDLTFQELTYPEDLQADLSHMQQLLAGQINSFQMEKRYIRKNGEVIWVNLICVPLWLEPTDHRQHIAMVEDITYRKQAEKSLQESEERFRTLYEDNPSMYFTVAQNGKILSVNQFGAQQLGYSVEELVGHPVLDLFPEEEKPLVQERFETCLRCPLDLFSWEFRKVRKDGNIVWVKEVARAVPSKNGEIVMLIVCEDISERKQTEKALKESKALTDSILGQLPMGFAYRCLNKKEWTVIYASDGIQEVTGFPASAFLSQTVTYDTLMAPGENDRVWPIVQDALSKHLPYQNEHQIITHEGKKKWILARGRFVFDKKGDLLYLDGLNVDITEYKQIQNELRTSEARFRSLVEHVPFCIHEIALNGKISSMNKAGQHMFGIENESHVIGHSYVELAQEKDHARIRDFFEQACQGQPIDFEFNETTHGKLRFFMNSFVPIREPNGTVLKIVGISDEITKRKEAEKQLFDSEAQRTEALRQSDELKSALLSSVSHELRTPLTAMKGSVSSIIGNGPSTMNLEQQDFLKGIDTEINYMSHLVDNLLDMSQIEAGTLIPHKEWHPLEDLLEGALRRTEQTIGTRNIGIHIPEDVPPVFVDAIEIQQVFINLLDNAVKYSFPSSPIRIHADMEASQIMVRVSNMGEPIQPQDLERIFERFYRRPPLRKQPIRGTGLGLAICKGIVEAHGGRIWADSIGQEVTIAFSIPIIEAMPDFSLEGRHKSKLE